MSILTVIILAIIQGLAELLPISSSAHVVVAEKLMGLDPSSPQMTLLLVMLHTGTMFAVLVYFWRTWKRAYFSSRDAFRRFVILVVSATVLTAIVGEALKKIIELTLFRGAPKAQIEDLFGRLDLIAPALAAAGILILIAGLRERHRESVIAGNRSSGEGTLSLYQAAWMGLIQGLALPFRGFSRSGSTISAGMLTGCSQGAGRTLQLCAGSCAHSACRDDGSHEADSRRARCASRRRTHRPARSICYQSARHVVLIPRRIARAQVAQQLARIGPLALVRRVLPRGVRGGLLFTCEGILRSMA